MTINEIKQLPTPRTPIQNRILENIKVSESGCWLWQGAITSRGYGCIWMNGKVVSSHRVSYEAFVGVINKSDVCHRCDVNSCVNPDHLFMGTHSENIQDLYNKGRNKNAKVQGATRVSLIADIEAGFSTKQLSVKYSLTTAAASFWKCRHNKRLVPTLLAIKEMNKQ